MSQISKAVLAAIAITSTLGAVQFASGHDLASRWQAAAGQPSQIVRHPGKADRLAGPKPFAAPMKTVSWRLNDLADTSVLLRIPSAQVRPTKPPMPPLNQRHRPTLACEPMVSALTEVARFLQPGRCVT